jgi:ATP-dependent helicase/DNAse subunit B
MPDKFTATWVSHTSISDFLHCPRAYYLKNVYKDPQTRHKVQLMSPALALGQAVHDVLESLSVLPTGDRLKESLVSIFNKRWQKVSGKRGGFLTSDQEERYRKRGEAMMRRVMENPGPLTRLAVKIKQDLPQFWLSEEDNIILCGKIDWMEYLPDQDAVHIIDFKTSKKEEESSSLQLPIYHLLVDRCQERQVADASYWYLELNDELTQKELPDLVAAEEQVLQLAKKIKLARQLERFKCPQGDEGCFHCRQMEKIVRGQAEFVGVNDYNQDIYILNADSDDEPESVIL